MRLFMTNGMFGRCLEQIGQEFKTFEDAMKELQEWKESPMNQKFYKIEPYDSLTFDEVRHEMAIDFGDYNTFMLVTNATKKDYDEYIAEEDV